eukprot:687549-Pleurochrysis_carterae.AAC.1
MSPATAELDTIHPGNCGLRPGHQKGTMWLEAEQDSIPALQHFNAGRMRLQLSLRRINVISCRTGHLRRRRSPISVRSCHLYPISHINCTSH